MSYTKLTDFAAKDALLSGNPSKLLRGTEIGAEFDAIESAMAAAEAVNITAPIIAASTSKTTPVDADVLPILDSAAANILKKVTWANIKATLKTYFDTLYMTVGGNVGAATATTPATSDNDTSVATTAFVQGELTSQTVKLTGNQTVAGVKTFSSMPVLPAQSMVRLHTSNGYGSTNTCILRFTTTVTSQGADITYADSATLGASFTINVSGVYAISACYANAAAGGQFGISLNTTQPTTPIVTISAPDRLCAATCGTSSGVGLNVSTAVYLPAGSVIRPHADTGASGLAAFSSFTMTRVS